MINTSSGVAINYWSIGSVLKRNQGMPVTAAQMKSFERGSSEVRIFAGGATYVDTDRANVPSKGLLMGPSIIVKSRGNIGFEFWNGLFSHKNELWSYSPKHAGVNIKYVYYYLESQTRNLHELAKSKSVKMPQLAVGDIDSLVVPFPELSIQNEIARILDTFALLEAELEAELDARKKQFAHYREVLFDFENDTSVDWLPLSDFAHIGTGNRNTNQAENEGQYPFFVRSQNALRSNEFDFDEEAVVTAGDGVGVGKVLHYVDGKYALHQRAYRISPKDDRVLAKFLFHFMKKDFGQYLQTTSVHASVTSLRRPMFEKYKVPVPNLTRQREIIVVLDALETLASDFESGIPGELAARRRQHAYYRDRLLAFEQE